jgi:hypothetical protein
VGQPGQAVLGLLYQTFGEQVNLNPKPLICVTAKKLTMQDYVDFFNEYAVRGADGKIPPWFQFDFGKPNISLAHAARRDYVPVAGQVWVDAEKQRVLVEMIFDEAAVVDAGAPAQAWFEFYEGQRGGGDLRFQV